MTKHLLFVGFSLQDPNFGEVAEEVRSTLRPQASARARLAPTGGAPPPTLPAGVAGASGAASGVGSSPFGTFGTLLSLHNRAFLAELWPDVRCVPMDLTDASQPHIMSSATCARQLDIFLDKLSLDASTTTRHLLDPDFSGVFDADELALRSHLVAFQHRLRANDAARRSSGYEIVREMLRNLGAQPERAEGRDLER